MFESKVAILCLFYFLRVCVCVCVCVCVRVTHFQMYLDSGYKKTASRSCYKWMLCLVYFCVLLGRNVVPPLSIYFWFCCWLKTKFPGILNVNFEHKQLMFAWIVSVNLLFAFHLSLRDVPRQLDLRKRFISVFLLSKTWKQTSFFSAPYTLHCQMVLLWCSHDFWHLLFPVSSFPFCSQRARSPPRLTTTPPRWDPALPWWQSANKPE